MVSANQRDDWLSLDDDELVSQCKVDNYRASGPGGQHRNKVSSAVRLRHEPSGVVSHAVESRSQHENKKRAIRRLRLEIALSVRAKVATNLRADAAMISRANAVAISRANAVVKPPSDDALHSRADDAARLAASGDADGDEGGAGGRAAKDDAAKEGVAEEGLANEGVGAYEPPAVFLQYRTKAGRIEVSTKNRDYALVVAAVLDVLAARMGSLKEAAALLGVSTSQLSRFITNEPPILRAANHIREENGMKHLTTGN